MQVQCKKLWALHVDGSIENYTMVSEEDITQAGSNPCTEMIFEDTNTNKKYKYIMKRSGGPFSTEYEKVQDFANGAAEVECPEVEPVISQITTWNEL